MLIDVSKRGLLRNNLWSSQFVTVSQFVTEGVAICDGCRNFWQKVSQFVTIFDTCQK